MTNSDLQLREASLDDATIVADLETRREPDEPRNPALLRHWWDTGDQRERSRRWVDERDGTAVAYVGASYEPWRDGERRYASIRLALDHARWSDDAYAQLVRTAEDWLRSEGAETAVARIREDFSRELAVIQRLGYREDRRMRTSELNLVARRDHILETVERCRRQMREQGIRLLTLAEDTDPEKHHKLYRAFIESEKDIPTTVPWRAMTFDQWRRFWLDNPAIREDMFWIARQGEEIVGTSVLDCPGERGVPWTAYTGTLRSVRGRGIARALKYESMAQAIAEGYERVRTNNDAGNPSILRINAEMGYELIAPVIELHRELGS